MDSSNETKYKAYTVVNDINKLLKNRSPIITIEDNNIYKCTFKELRNITNIDTPVEQVNLDDDKINDMIKAYTTNKHYFLGKCLITISKTTIDENIQYYIMDGQHRIEMIKRLPSTENVEILLSIININTIEEFHKLFNELNIDSLKYKFKNLSIFEKQNLYSIKKELKYKYTFTPKKSSETNPLYTISEFIDQIGNSFSALNIIEILEEKNKLFLDKLSYLEIINDYSFSETEKKCILQHKNIMFFKKNNFINYLLDDTVEPYHDFIVRQKIPKALSIKVWKNEFNEKTNGKCPIFNCDNILDINTVNSWQCGHIISVFNKGLTTLENLRVICPKCNNNMKHNNWSDYIDKKIKEYIIDNSFDNDDEIEIKCKKKNCKNKISIENFKYYSSTKTNNIKPCCNTCYIANK
jgi:hypothetical protein